MVKGVVLIDSPSPLNHTPLSDEFIDSIVNIGDLKLASSNRMSFLVKRQFQTNSQMLLKYSPTAGTGPIPQLVLLRSREDYSPSGGPEIPEWLSRGRNHVSAVAGWEEMVGIPVKCIDIEGNHFQPFQSPYVRIGPIFSPTRVLKT